MVAIPRFLHGCFQMLSNRIKLIEQLHGNYHGGLFIKKYQICSLLCLNNLFFIKLLLDIMGHFCNKSICPTFSFQHEQPAMWIGTCMILNSNYWSLKLIQIHYCNDRNRDFISIYLLIYLFHIFDQPQVSKQSSCW